MPNNLTTVGVDFFSKDIQHNNENYRVQIWDTAGEELFKSIAVNFYKECHGVVACYDVANRKSFENLEYWLQEVHNNAHQNIPILVLGTKTDLKDKRKVSSKEGVDFSSQHKTLFSEVSSLTNEDCCVEKAFLLLINQLLKTYSEEGVRSQLNQNISAVSKGDRSETQVKSADCCSN